MLILKGENGKSRVLTDIAEYTDSCYWVYNNYELPVYSYHINSYEISLSNLIEELEAYLNNNPNVPMEYFMLYTNKTEDELSKVIKWLEQNEKRFNCRYLILGCK